MKPEEVIEQIASGITLLYVAMTRAREFLVVTYSDADGLVPQLKACESEYEKYRDGILDL